MKAIVADDHSVVRDGVSMLLKSLDATTEILEAGTCAEVRRMLDDHPDADLLILDLGMPPEPCDIKNLVARFPGKLVILSATESGSVIREVISLGAAGYIPKSMNSKIMRHALQCVFAGGVYVPPQALGGSHAETPAAEAATEGPGGGRPSLSDRQMSVLALLAEGLSNKEIARRLDLSTSTVKVHVASVMRALNTTSRAKAVHMAIQLGLLAAD